MLFIHLVSRPDPEIKSGVTYLPLARSEASMALSNTGEEPWVRAIYFLSFRISLMKTYIGMNPDAGGDTTETKARCSCPALSTPQNKPR
jgi:hypothetical protein